MAGPAGVLGCVLLLSLLSVFVEVKHLGLSWHETAYRTKLENIVAGTAGAPAAQRPLSAWLALGCVRAAEAVGLPRGAGVALIALKLSQNMLLFLLALAIYRRLGIHPYLGLIGLSAITWGMTQAHDPDGLAFDTYTDLILYLLTAWVALARRPYWVVPIALIAALNRESSILIPAVLLGGAGMPPRQGSESGKKWTAVKHYVTACCCAFVVWFFARQAVSVCVGTDYGVSDILRPTAVGGTGNAALNPDFWAELIGIVGLVPILSLFGWRAWMPPLKCWFHLFGLVFIFYYVFAGTPIPAQAWLLPQTLIFVPGLLLFILSVRRSAWEGKVD